MLNLLKQDAAAHPCSLPYNQSGSHSDWLCGKLHGWDSGCTSLFLPLDLCHKVFEFPMASMFCVSTIRNTDIHTTINRLGKGMGVVRAGQFGYSVKELDGNGKQREATGG